MRPRSSITLRRFVGATVATIVVATPLHAQVSWTDWTSFGTNTASGTLMVGSTPVGVTYSGPYSFVQTGCGTNYYVPNVYTNGTTVPNPPTPCDIVALNQGAVNAGSPHTITFSQAISNPLLALVSWNNQPVVTFNGPVTVIAQGCGYWGCGSMTAAGNTILTNGGEVHGTIMLSGNYTSITISEPNDENWHGFTVGVQGLASSTAPEPASLALLGSGLLALGAVVRRRRA